MEPLYGTLFYAAVNAWLAVVSNCEALLFRHAMIYWMPRRLGAGAKYITTCSVGYSNVLFGLLTVGCCQGGQFADFWGIKMPKKLIPFILLAFNTIMVPGADVVGHLTGIFAAFFVKYAGFYFARLLPRFEWINEFESQFQPPGGYYRATERIAVDFDLLKLPSWLTKSRRAVV